MNQDQVVGVQTSHGIVGAVLLALGVIILAHIIGFRVVVTTALRAGRSV